MAKPQLTTDSLRAATDDLLLYIQTLERAVPEVGESSVKELAAYLDAVKRNPIALAMLLRQLQGG